MKIAFLGNFSVDYCSEVHYLKTLQALGHSVFPLQEGKATASDISNATQDVDMFFWVHTHGWHTQGIESVLNEMKSNGVPSVGYHLDLWLGIAREKDLEIDPYWKIDYFFSVDQLMVELLNSRPDLPKAFYLPAGVFEPECYLGKKQEKYSHDVIFVGSRGYHPEWPYRKQLIEWLERTYGNKFAQYGGGGLGTIRGQELNDLYASAKIVIGDTLCKDFNYPYYLSDRIFETTGRGGFIIHPYIHGIGDLFCTQESIKYNITPDLITYPFNDFGYLRYVIDYYLENEKEREQIRLNGFNQTRKHYTYTNRLTHIINVIKHELSVINGFEEGTKF